MDDIALFLAVCDAGGLIGAVAHTGVSAPTLSRRMTALEQQTGRRLFLRGNKGYALTAEGRALRAEAETLSALQDRIARWSNAGGAVRVRITSGTWTSRWLARNLPQYWTPSAGWLPEFLASNAVLDIARREADIGLRNRRPEQSWLAAQRMRRIEYVEYGVDPSITEYVTLADHIATTPSTRWVHDNRPDRIATTVNNARLELDLARAGIARVVLPIMVGDVEPGLMRLSEPIADLAHDEWLVTHHESRHDPPVRRAIDAIARFIERGNG